MIDDFRFEGILACVVDAGPILAARIVVGNGVDERTGKHGDLRIMQMSRVEEGQTTEAHVSRSEGRFLFCRRGSRGDKDAEGRSVRTSVRTRVSWSVRQSVSLSRSQLTIGATYTMYAIIGSQNSF